MPNPQNGQTHSVNSSKNSNFLPKRSSYGALSGIKNKQSRRYQKTKRFWVCKPIFTFTVKRVDFVD